uniref:Uncharacterized protein n=1 Tax=Amphimedon queenslandica TaxID=400682 RepID=A0A1X7SWU6_AMPQE
MHGAPGAGKTCSQHLLLNEPPPSCTDSTPIACPAIRATRISIDGKNKWERVELKDLYKQLASHLKEAPDETKREKKSDKASLDIDDDGSESDKDETDNEPTDNKPIEKESAEIEKKQTEIKPAETEVMKEVISVHRTENVKKLSTNWVYFIDSGGQPAYRELLPLFTRAAALNIITIDLTKGLDEKCRFQYHISQHTSPINTELKYSNCGIIQSTISSEAMLNSIKIPYVSDMPKHSHYLILGTRKDELEKRDKLGELNEMNILLLKEYKDNRKVIMLNERQGLVIFPVNTLLPAGSKEREKASVSLCKAISNFGVEMTIELPIRLLTFEISLQREAKKKERSFLTKEEAVKIGKSLRLDDESDIDDALQYLHDVTIILYYRKVLPNIIFVDPKPILDVFSHLIAITYVDHDKLDLLAEPPPSRDETYNLIKFGLFKEDVFKKIGIKLKIFDKNLKSSHMIKLLIHLHIIAKVENRKEGDYFFPCALPSYDKLNPAPTEIQPLLIAWEINNNGTTTLAIPQGLFPLTIVHLLEQKGKVDFSPDPDLDNKFYRYHDAMSLRVYNNHFIHIINRYTHIEIHFRGDCKNSCQRIRELVTDAITKSRKDLNVDDDHIFAFKCPQKERYCIVRQDDKSSTWYSHCTHCETQCKVLESDDSYKCWFFSDSLLSSPGAEASSEDPPSKKCKEQHTAGLSAAGQFRRISARLGRSISSCLTTVSMNLNAEGLITQELHDEMINGRDIDSKKAPKLVNAIQSRLNTHTNPEAYLKEVCSALKDVGEKQITGIVNELERKLN